MEINDERLWKRINFASPLTKITFMMKRILIVALAIGFAGGAFAQDKKDKSVGPPPPPPPPPPMVKERPIPPPPPPVPKAPLGSYKIKKGMKVPPGAPPPPSPPPPPPPPPPKENDSEQGVFN